ncbi:MAG: hypothetical protein JSU74_12035 [Candidatus Zixiibacteriota bacterium]|nr:MAG: hypothetical protein JSU74_12035 [candidate division Zixibacteria bacterium]
MKRLIAVLALLLILPAFLWSPAALAKDIYYTEGDDHPWGEEEGNDEPGRHRHSNSEEAEAVLCGYLPGDVILTSQIFFDDLRTFIFGPDQIKTGYPSERDTYLDHTRKASLK